MYSVLFYGDSNTWGFNPENTLRYAYEERYVSICAKALGEDFLCIPAGMNGRTTVFTDPVKGCRNGAEGLDYALQTHKPLDLLVIMLGTNDLKFTDAEGSAAGMDRLMQLAVSANERFALSSPVFPDGAHVLLISPVLVTGSVGRIEVPAGTGGKEPGKPFTEALSGGTWDDYEESAKLAGLYRQIAQKYHAGFLDAATVTPPSEADGVHLSREGHQRIGAMAADWIRAFFAGR